MEILGLIDLPIWLVCILILVLTIVIYTSWKRKTFSRQGITTKPSKFFLGDLNAKGIQVDASMVKKYGKVFGIFFGNTPILIITDIEMIKQILVKQFPSFQERIKLNAKYEDKFLSLAEREHWRFLRNSLSPCFTTGKIRKMNANLFTCLEKLNNNIHKQIEEHPEGFNISGLFESYAMDFICSTGFGMDVDSQNDLDNPFVKYARKLDDFKGSPLMILQMFFPDMPGLNLVKSNMFPQDSMDFYEKACKTLFEERKKSNSDFPDLLQTMLNAQKDAQTDISGKERKTETTEEKKQRGLTDEEVIFSSFVFMIGGYSTTSGTLGWLAYDLALHPDCQEKLHQEIDEELGKQPPSYESVLKLQYLEMIIQESMRIHPVGSGISRRPKEDIEICGVRIPKDMAIFIPHLAVHFLPEYWEEPEEFKPERFSPENKHNIHEYAYLPFGNGPRNCIGMRLAMLNVKMTLASIMQKYRFVRTDQLMVPMPGKSPGLFKPAEPIFIQVVRR